MSAHPESYGHWDHAQISLLLYERDRLRAEVAAKEKFVKDAIAACSNAGRLRELLLESKEWMDDYFRLTPEGRDLCDRIDAALGGEVK